MANGYQAEYFVNIGAIVDNKESQKNIKALAKSFSKAVDDMEKEASGMVLFKNAENRLSALTTALHGLGLDDMIGHIDDNLASQLDKVVKLNIDQLNNIPALREKLAGATTKEEAKAVTDEINGIYFSIGKKSGIDARKPFDDMVAAGNNALDGLESHFNAVNNKIAKGFGKGSGINFNAIIRPYLKEFNDAIEADADNSKLNDIKKRLQEALVFNDNDFSQLSNIFDSYASGDIDDLNQAVNKAGRIAEKIYTINALKGEQLSTPLASQNQDDLKKMQPDTAPLEQQGQAYDKLIEKVKEYKNIIDEVNKNNGDITEEQEDRQSKLIEDIKGLSKKKLDSDGLSGIGNVMGDLEFGDIDENTALSKLAELLGIIPQKAQGTADAIKEVDSAIDSAAAGDGKIVDTEAIDRAKAKLQEFEDFAEQINNTKYGYDSDARLGEERGKLQEMERGLQDLAKQGLLTEEQMREVAQAFDKAESKISTQLNNNDSYNQGRLDEFEAAADRLADENEALKDKNKALEEQLADQTDSGVSTPNIDTDNFNQAEAKLKEFLDLVQQVQNFSDDDILSDAELGEFGGKIMVMAQDLQKLTQQGLLTEEQVKKIPQALAAANQIITKRLADNAALREQGTINIAGGNTGEQNVSRQDELRAEFLKAKAEYLDVVNTESFDNTEYYSALGNPRAIQEAIEHFDQLKDKMDSCTRGTTSYYEAMKELLKVAIQIRRSTFTNDQDVAESLLDYDYNTADSTYQDVFTEHSINAYNYLSSEFNKLESDNPSITNDLKRKVDGVAGAGNGQLTSENQNLTKVKAAINEKTEAFRDEASTVDQVVTQEIASLSRLKEYLELIKKTVQELFLGRQQKIGFHSGDLDYYSKTGRRSESLGISGGQLGSGYGAYGTGIYYVSDPNKFTGSGQHSDTTSKLYALDLSKYNMYTAQTSEQADQLYNFLSTLEKFVLKSSGFKGFDEDLKGIDVNKLYSEMQNVFKNIQLPIERLQSFINETSDFISKQGVDSYGDIKGIKGILENADDVSTQFMRLLGYQGVDVRNTNRDNFNTGSVIFDLDQSSPYIKSFDSINEATEYNNTLLRQTGGIQDTISQSADGWLAKLKDIVTTIDLIDQKLHSVNNQEQKNTTAMLGAANKDTTPTISSLKGVEDAVNTKTDAFENEGSVVNSIVSGEIEQLNKLKTTLEEIKTAVGLMFDEAKGKELLEGQNGNAPVVDAAPVDEVEQKLREFVDLSNKYKKISSERLLSKEEDAGYNEQLQAMRDHLIEIQRAGKLTDEQMGRLFRHQQQMADVSWENFKANKRQEDMQTPVDYEAQISNAQKNLEKIKLIKEQYDEVSNDYNSFKKNKKELFKEDVYTPEIESISEINKLIHSFNIQKDSLRFRSPDDPEYYTRLTEAIKTYIKLKNTKAKLDENEDLRKNLITNSDFSYGYAGEVLDNLDGIINRSNNSFLSKHVNASDSNALLDASKSLEKFVILTDKLKNKSDVLNLPEDEIRQYISLLDELEEKTRGIYVEGMRYKERRSAAARSRDNLLSALKQYETPEENDITPSPAPSPSQPSQQTNTTDTEKEVGANLETDAQKLSEIEGKIREVIKAIKDAGDVFSSEENAVSGNITETAEAFGRLKTALDDIKLSIDAIVEANNNRKLAEEEKPKQEEPNVAPEPVKPEVTKTPVKESTQPQQLMPEQEQFLAMMEDFDQVNKAKKKMVKEDLYPPAKTRSGTMQLLSDFYDLEEAIRQCEQGSDKYYDSLNKLLELSIKLRNTQNLSNADSELHDSLFGADDYGGSPLESLKYRTLSNRSYFGFIRDEILNPPSNPPKSTSDGNTPPPSDNNTGNSGGDEAPKNKGYALESTLGIVKGILDNIYGAVTSGKGIGSVLSSLEEAASELQKAATSLTDLKETSVTEPAPKESPYTEANLRILNNRDEIEGVVRSKVEQSAVARGEAEIGSIKAMEDGMVSVSGAIKNAKGEWEGFTVEVDRANETALEFTGTQSVLAEKMNKDDAQDETTKKIEKQKEATKKLKEFYDTSKKLQDFVSVINMPTDELDEYIAKLDALKAELKSFADGGFISAQEMLKVTGADNAAIDNIFKATEAKGNGITGQMITSSTEGLNKIKASVQGMYKSLGLNAMDSGLTERQILIVSLYEKATATINERIAAVQRGEKIETKSIDNVIAKLREEIAAYKASDDVDILNTGNTKGSKYGAAKVLAEQTRYKRLSEAAKSVGYAQSPEFQAKFKAYDDAYMNQLIKKRKAIAALDTVSDSQRTDFDKTAKDVANAGRELENIIKASERISAKGYTTNLRDDFVNDLSGRKKALSDYVMQMHGARATIEYFDDENHKMLYTLNNGDGTFSRMTATIDGYKRTLTETTGRTEKATSMFGRFFNEVGRKVKSVGSYLIASTGIQEVFQQVRKGFQYVKEIDTALTELKKVTDETDVTYKEFLNDMSEAGSRIGATTANLTSMAAEWGRFKFRPLAW